MSAPIWQMRLRLVLADALLTVSDAMLGVAQAAGGAARTLNERVARDVDDAIERMGES